MFKIEELSPNRVLSKEHFHLLVGSEQIKTMLHQSLNLKMTIIEHTIEDGIKKIHDWCNNTCKDMVYIEDDNNNRLSYDLSFKMCFLNKDDLVAFKLAFVQ